MYGRQGKAKQSGIKQTQSGNGNYHNNNNKNEYKNNGRKHSKYIAEKRVNLVARFAKR